ncbi:hypothetical protein B7R54_16165 [Subtercola boreus]|uniref:HTH tetR-type domain-containing protein n=1 Tax=Subtercola boreus TaxID=120213 RepID=A0A3E0VMA1_9MICO|nr:TetR/AcrR family transcriptional regulator [Subtercola boreus]RFA10570.1 hypothetical protein B7R54_16165 [Subtercola boreus]TQL55888.1 TetR family transcriptional regulator [Subtercola boreus]
MPLHPSPRPDPSEELKAVALRLFVETSYAGASLQQIADAAGYSKSSVLYHFASKEALLEEALTPAVVRLDSLFQGSIGRIADADLRGTFVEDFIDFLLVYGLEAHIIINQGQSLAGIPIIDRATDFLRRLSDSFVNELATPEQRIRLGIALSGAAYVVATGVAMQATDQAPIEEARSALIAVVTELLVPFAAPAVTL